MQAKLQGNVGLQLDSVNAVCNKLADKIQRKAIVSLQQVYNYLGTAGYDYPTVASYSSTPSGTQPNPVATGPTLAGGQGNDTTPGVDFSPEPIPIATPGPTAGIGLDIGPTLSAPTQPEPITPGIVPQPVPELPPKMGPPTGGVLPSPIGGNVLPPITTVPPTTQPSPVSGDTSPAGSGGGVINPGYTPPGMTPPPSPVPQPTPTCPPGMYWHADPFAANGGECLPGVVGQGAQPAGQCPNGATYYEGAIPLQLPHGASVVRSSVRIPQSGDAANPCTIVGIQTIAPPTGQLTQTGLPCIYDPKYYPGASETNTPSKYIGRCAVQPAISWEEGQIPSQSDPTKWDIVEGMHWYHTPPPTHRGAAWWLIPHGWVLMQDPADGVMYTANGTCPNLCVQGEYSRYTFTCNQQPGGGGGVCVTPPSGGTCPAPQPLDCGADAKFPAIPGIDDGPKPCDQMNAAVDKIRGDALHFADVFKIKNGQVPPVQGVAAQIIGAIFGNTEPGMISTMMDRFGHWLEDLIKTSAGHLNCDPISLLPILINRAVFRFLNKWTDSVPDQLMNNMEQLSNFTCQSELPSGAAADRAYLMGEITLDDWQCYHKAAGDYLAPAKQMMRAGRTKPNVNEIIDLYRRELIDSDALDKRLCEHGVIDSSDRTDLINLADQYPHLTDLIRFMVRDVFDDSIVNDGNLDKDFDAKYTDVAKRLGKAIGLPDWYAKYAWRAHWQYPSYTQLREMVHRLRPDKYPADMAVDTPTMQKALEVDDHAPAYVKRLIEIAYRPMPEYDAERMYNIRQIDEDGLLGVYLDNGYNKDDSTARVEYAKTQRKFYDLQRAGYPSLRRLNQLYGQCLLDSSTLQDAMQKWVTSDDQLQEAMDAADINRQVNDRKVLIQNVRKEYRLGLLSDDGAAQQLAQGGIDPGCVGGLVRTFKGQRQKQPKQVPATTLCKWFGNRLITAEQMLLALQRLGYTEGDALNIVRECEIEQDQKQQKAQAAAAAKAQKIAASEAKAAAKAAKPAKPAK